MISALKNTVSYFFSKMKILRVSDTFFPLERQTRVSFKLYSLRRLWRSRRVKTFDDIRDVGALEIRHSVYTREIHYTHVHGRRISL